jgi:hypothetical protein
VNDQERLAMAQLQQRNQQLEQVCAMRGRVAIGTFSEGLQALLLGARGGDPGAQQDLRVLRDLLGQVAESADDPKSRITVVRRPD